MKAVEKGAAFLDEVDPGWEAKLDLDTLDLGSCRNCVLGQLWRADHPRSRVGNPYEREAKQLGLNPWDERETGRLGFMEFGRARFRNITAAWRREIQRRRKS